MKNRLFIFTILLPALFVIISCGDETPGTATSSDGVTIAFDSQGKGKPAIIFVHGWTNPRTIWDDQMKQFSAKYQAVALDLAGSGESGNNRSEWTMNAFSNDVIAVIDKLKLDEVVLVGFSMGAAVVVETANQIPEKVKGVVIVDNMQNPEGKLPPQMIPVVDSMMMDLLNNMSNEKLVAMGFYKTNQEANYERVLRLYPEDVSQIGWQEALLGNMKWMNEDCIKSLQQLQVPLHAINSDMEPTEVEIFKKYVPGFKAKIITGVGHLVFWEKPDEFQRLLDESIQEFMKQE
ncbi:alpha/beta hydrolase [uncultured Draconibacterium sp.]|uniref:alpha/beta fold hydrolase n=1 Tax=uncultured Draconibacterium sp. TaxID=1573823 RepID=UPI0025EB547D|nr:alpha/beta hydrolase [uncultured Draconibacterium sp.]